jgi:colanic acid biosynthesis glycosyl transferase WcaI
MNRIKEHKGYLRISMRILILSQWCWPEPGTKALPLAQGLVERGHEVTLITGYPNYPSGKIYEGYKQKLWSSEHYNGVHIVRLPLYPSHDRSSIRRVLNYFSFALSASMLGPFLSGPADILWVYHPPLTVGIPTMWISLLRRIPFIYEIQDMWPETVATSGMMKNPLALRILAGMAKFIYRQAAGITVISPGFRQNLIEKGVPAEKITVLPNWGEDYYQPLPRDMDLGAQHNLIGKFNIMFAGNMGPAQALSIVIEAAALLQDIPDIQFVLVGDGIELPALRQQAQQANVKNVLFVGRQPSEQMPTFFAWAEALLVQLRNDPLFAITIPSKTQAYLASGRPILCGVPGDGANIVREAGAGLVFEPENAEALAQAVRKLYAMPSEARTAMGQHGRLAYERQFSRSILIERYDELFHSIVQARKPASRKALV